MAAPKQILDEFDDTANSLIESIEEVQTNIYTLYSTVGDLIKSMSTMLKSMTEMKEAAIQPTAPPPPTPESKITADENLPETPLKHSIEEEEKEEPLYAYLKKIQIEMPVFQGGLDVNLWISRAERYFEIGDFTEKEKLRLVYMSVDGEALSWFSFWNRREPFIDWFDFRARLLDRFGDNSTCVSARTSILGLNQVDSVVSYLGRFEELATRLHDESDSFLEDVFVYGLKEEIQDMLSLFKPKGLRDVITMAIRLEKSPFCRLLNQNPPSCDDAIDKKT